MAQMLAYLPPGCKHYSKTASYQDFPCGYLWDPRLIITLNDVAGDLVINDYGSSVATASITAAAVPEPSTYALFTLGFAGLALWKRRQKKA
jgi:hypothetical protein